MAISQSHDILPMNQPKTGIVSPNEFNERQINEMLRNSNSDLPAQYDIQSANRINHQVQAVNQNIQIRSNM